MPHLLLPLLWCFVASPALQPGDAPDGSARAPTPVTDRLKELSLPLLRQSPQDLGTKILNRIEECRRWEALEGAVGRVVAASPGTLWELVRARVRGKLVGFLPDSMGATGGVPQAAEKLLEFGRNAAGEGPAPESEGPMPLVPGVRRATALARLAGGGIGGVDWHDVPPLLAAIEAGGVVVVEEARLSAVRERTGVETWLTVATLRADLPLALPRTRQIEELARRIVREDLFDAAALYNELLRTCPGAPVTQPIVTPTASETLCYMAYALRVVFAEAEPTGVDCDAIDSGERGARPRLDTISIDVQPLRSGGHGRVALAGLAPSQAFAEHIRNLVAATPCFVKPEVRASEQLGGRTELRFYLDFDISCPSWTCGPAAASWCWTEVGASTTTQLREALDGCPGNLDALLRPNVCTHQATGGDGALPRAAGPAPGDGKNATGNAGSDEAETPRWKPDRPYAEWIVEGEVKGEYRVDRKHFLEAMEHLDVVGRDARIVPHMTAGKFDGMKLVGVRPDSIHKAAGFRSGDIVTRVNGVALDSPGRLASKVLLPAGADRIEVELLRKGETLKLVYLLH